MTITRWALTCRETVTMKPRRAEHGMRMHMASGLAGVMSAASGEDQRSVSARPPGPHKCSANGRCDWQVLPARGQRQCRQSRSFGGRSAGLSLPRACHLVSTTVAPYLPPRANRYSATVPSYHQDKTTRPSSPSSPSSPSTRVRPNRPAVHNNIHIRKGWLPH